MLPHTFMYMLYLLLKTTFPFLENVYLATGRVTNLKVGLGVLSRFQLTSRVQSSVLLEETLNPSLPSSILSSLDTDCPHTFKKYLKALGNSS